MNERETRILQAVFRFSPISISELKWLVPEVPPETVESTSQDLLQNEYLRTVQNSKTDENTSHVELNTGKLPLDEIVELDDDLRLQLSSSQYERFERLRASFSHTRGKPISRQEFIDFILDESAKKINDPQKVGTQY